MGMELQLRQSNSGSFSTQFAELKSSMTFEKAKHILGAYCIRTPKCDDRSKQEEAIRVACAQHYLKGYPEANVVDLVKDCFPACTRHLLAHLPRMCLH